MDYGKDYWEGDCLCDHCVPSVVPPRDPSPAPLENTNQQIREEDDKREKRRLKQRERRANKKARLAVERASRTA